jgi:hypothetical protein
VTLAAMLGHSKINMVLRYAHPTQEHQTKAMDKMEQYVSEQKIVYAERQRCKCLMQFNRGSRGVSTESAVPATFFATVASAALL